jgi:hypothetical protein
MIALAHMQFANGLIKEFGQKHIQVIQAKVHVILYEKITRSCICNHNKSSYQLSQSHTKLLDKMTRSPKWKNA